MGQCMGSLWSDFSWRNIVSTTRLSGRSTEYYDGTQLRPAEEENSPLRNNLPPRVARQMQGKPKSLSGIFSLTKNKKKHHHQQYIRQDDDDEDSASIELYDMVLDPRFMQSPQNEMPSELHTSTASGGGGGGRGRGQPDVRQIAGLRNTLTCCVMPRRGPYAQLPNDYSYGDGGAAFIVLDPRNLNGHQTIPAPPTRPSPGLSRSKWSVNSAGSTEDCENCKQPSIDLEWENDDAIVPSFARTNANNDNRVAMADDPSSVASIIHAKGGSRASSHNSIPGLDWDSQVDNDDLVSLNNEMDFETEQLIGEIELLTSRALQETQQWSQGSPPQQKGQQQQQQQQQTSLTGIQDPLHQGLTMTPTTTSNQVNVNNNAANSENWAMVN